MSNKDPLILKPELSEGQTVREFGEHRIIISRAQNVAEVLAKLGPLLNGQGDPPKQRWNLCLDGKGIRRSFYFKGFKKTWSFMQAVAEECKSKNHHPEWWNAYNHTFIQWTTHRPEGLSIKDVDMAIWCDEQAKLHEERFDVEPAPLKTFDFV